MNEPCDIPGCGQFARFRLQRMYHPLPPGADPGGGNAQQLEQESKVSYNEYCVPCLQKIVAAIPPTAQDQGAMAPAVPGA